MSPLRLHHYSVTLFALFAVLTAVFYDMGWHGHGLWNAFFTGWFAIASVWTFTLEHPERATNFYSRVLLRMTRKYVLIQTYHDRIVIRFEEEEPIVEMQTRGPEEWETVRVLAKGTAELNMITSLVSAANSSPTGHLPKRPDLDERRD